MLSEVLVLMATGAAQAGTASLPDPPPRPEDAVEVPVASADEVTGETDGYLLPSEEIWSGRERTGLLVRFSMGPAYLWGSFEGTREGSDVIRRLPIEGFAGAAETVVAGAPVPGLALGARIAITSAPRPVFREGGASEEMDALHVLQGGFIVDWYLIPDGGFHLFASTGLAMLPDPSPLFHDLQSGLAWSGGVGYELPMSEFWAAGLTLRVDGAYLQPDASVEDATFTFACPTAQLTFTGG